MDGKARWVDNVLIERWFRSLKCEDIYINEYTSPKELRRNIKGIRRQTVATRSQNPSPRHRKVTGGGFEFFFYFFFLAPALFNPSSIIPIASSPAEPSPALHPLEPESLASPPVLPVTVRVILPTCTSPL